jgi:hypothetical protein
MLPTKFRFIWPRSRGFRGEDFFKSANQKQELPMAAMWPPQTILVSDWLISKKLSPLKPLCQMNRNSVGGILGRSSIKMLISFRSVNKHGRHRQFLFLIGWFLKNLLLCNRLAETVHLAKQLQRRRFFRNQPIRNKNYLWWPCLLMDRDEMSNLL